MPLDEDDRLEFAVSSGIVIPTTRVAEPIREAARRLHLVHRPYDLEYLITVPVRADIRWTRGRFAVQSGIAAHAVLDYGDPELDMILTTAAVGHRLPESFELVAHVSLLAIPPGEYSVSVDAGVERQFGDFELLLRLYKPSLPSFDTGAAVALDASRRFE